MIRFPDLPDITPGHIVQQHGDPLIHDIIIDSRKLAPSGHSIFIAIKGERHDGHDYVRKLHQAGVRQFVVTYLDPSWEALQDASFFQVENTVRALQDLAAFNRLSYDLRVIGITGSNGKTIVKEWLAELLGSKYFLVKNPKSYNSQIGVPLSVWQISEQHELGIFEAGISTRDEMMNLASIIRPEIGIFTNIGPAHDAGFHSQEEKIEEKSRLFDRAQLVIYCKDHHPIDTFLLGSGKSLLSWGHDHGSTIRISSFDPRSSRILLESQFGNFMFALPFRDKASVENLMHCIAFMIHDGYTEAEIQERISSLSHMHMRLELKQGINNCYLIDDSYSNDLGSLEIALDFMNQQPLLGKKTLILSDILQSGIPNNTLYNRVADILKIKQVDRIIGIGKDITSQSDLFKDFDALFFEQTGQVIQDMESIPFDHELILIKGARSFGFEQLVKLLQHKVHGTVLEINLDALVYNLNFFRSRLMPTTKIMVMVKAFGYGSGSSEIAHLLQYHNVDYLGVAYTDEGVLLRENGVHIPIMVMNPRSENFEQLVQHELEPEIYSMELLDEFAHFLMQRNHVGKIHLKLDTGMHRLGFQMAEMETLMAKLKAYESAISVVGVFSHLAGADEEKHITFSKNQAKQFQKMSDSIFPPGTDQPLKHLINSAGIIRYPEFQFDMVRLGIGLYGYEANQLEQDKLMPVSTLKTTVSQVMNVRQGDTIGYSRKGVATKDMQVATIAIGYADGFRRSLSDGVGQVLIKGHRVPVVGNVCMDMTMVDVTGKNVHAGDTVTIFGHGLPITELAEWGNTIPYEILTNVSQRVKRVFFTE